jgi:alpha-1,3-glucan synthase
VLAQLTYLPFLSPDWQRQLAKFASVQDRLREWDPLVAKDLAVFPCLMIESLDIDGIRVDKATQITVDGSAHWANATRACAKGLNKTNFFIPGEVTGGDTFGSLYIGRGRTPYQNNRTFEEAIAATPANTEMFIREQGMTGWDATAFHYSFYRALTRLMQMDGNVGSARSEDEAIERQF